jgi:hypothetical protein
MLGVLIGSLILIVGVVYMIICESKFIPVSVAFLLMISGMAILIIGCIYAENMPQNETDLYKISGIDNQPSIYFQDYSFDGDNIVIPTHHYIEYSWINSWKYCNTPITVIVPKGMSVSIKGGLKGKIHIVGGCQ